VPDSMSAHPTPADQPSRNASRIKILNWPNAKKEETIDDKMPLVRYMKLETFLLLLDNRLFIPTLKLLQGGDRLESRIPEKLCPNYWKKMQPVVADRDHEQWLLRMARRPKIFREEGSRLTADPKLLTEIWLEELQSAAASGAGTGQPSRSTLCGSFTGIAVLLFLAPSATFEGP
jgi:hypothetical protein